MIKKIFVASIFALAANSVMSATLLKNTITANGVQATVIGRDFRINTVTDNEVVTNYSSTYPMLVIVEVHPIRWDYSSGETPPLSDPVTLTCGKLSVIASTITGCELKYGESAKIQVIAAHFKNGADGSYTVEYKL